MAEVTLHTIGKSKLLVTVDGEEATEDQIDLILDAINDNSTVQKILTDLDL